MTEEELKKLKTFPNNNFSCSIKGKFLEVKSNFKRTLIKISQIKNITTYISNYFSSADKPYFNSNICIDDFEFFLSPSELTKEQAFEVADKALDYIYNFVKFDDLPSNFTVMD